MREPLNPLPMRVYECVYVCVKKMRAVELADWRLDIIAKQRHFYAMGQSTD